MLSPQKPSYLLAALKQLDETPKDWKRGLLQGMFWLTDQLLKNTEGHPQHDYTHGHVKTIQAYIELAFKDAEHKISDMAVESCSRILTGISDNDHHA